MILPYDHIVITSDEPFGGMFHTQILFSGFLSKENQVIYFDPPQKWRPANFFGQMITRQVSPTFTILSYHNYLPSCFSIFRRLNEEYNKRKLLEFLRSRGSRKILFWHFDSYRNALIIKERGISYKRIYHVIDPYYRNPLDSVLSQEADLLIVTSSRNIPHYEKYAKKLLHLPQVIDLEQERSFLNGAASEIPEPYLVLLGTLSDDVDYNWLQNLAETESQRLVLIGRAQLNAKANAFRSLLRSRNVKFMGELSPREFYPVLKKATAGLIVYDLQRKEQVRSPLKALNYLVAGIPVISNIDSEISELSETCIFYRKEQRAFMQVVQEAVKQQAGFDAQAADAYLNKVTMHKALQTISDRLN